MAGRDLQVDLPDHLVEVRPGSDVQVGDAAGAPGHAQRHRPGDAAGLARVSQKRPPAGETPRVVDRHDELVLPTGHEVIRQVERAGRVHAVVVAADVFAVCPDVDLPDRPSDGEPCGPALPRRWRIDGPAIPPDAGQITNRVERRGEPRGLEPLGRLEAVQLVVPVARHDRGHLEVRRVGDRGDVSRRGTGPVEIPLPV